MNKQLPQFSKPEENQDTDSKIILNYKAGYIDIHSTQMHVIISRKMAKK